MNKNKELDDYIVYVLSMKLKELADSRNKIHRHQYVQYTNDSNWMPAFYNTYPKQQNEEEVRKREQQVISLQDAINVLLEKGANSLVLDDENNLVLQSVLSSNYFNQSHKINIIEQMNENAFKSLPKIQMNNLFSNITKILNNIQTDKNEKKIWTKILDQLFEKGLTYHQGKSIISNEINFMHNNGLIFFELLAQKVPSFNFDQAYKIDDDNFKTLSEIGEDFLKRNKDYTRNQAEETIQFIKSYTIYKKIEHIEKVEKPEGKRKNKL